MEQKDYQQIQDQIGYVFKNQDLLQQAFVRRSYSKENGGGDNEVLEFIGDKVLDVFVVRYLTDRFGYMADRNEPYQEFFCHYTEGRLTDLKSHMVSKNSLSRRIDALGFAQYLIMGKGDIKMNADEEPSVKEDLFEAILGAVAIDSGWDYLKLQSVVETMLDPDSFFNMNEENYVQIIQEWNQQKNGKLPVFQYLEMPKVIFGGQDCVSDRGNNIKRFSCDLFLDQYFPTFRGFGTSQNNARKDACKRAYDWLERNHAFFSICDEIDTPNIDEAIGQLETLSRRGYFSLPEYTAYQGYDFYGNFVWSVECRIKEESVYFCAKAPSKKVAKKQAAYDMLMHVLSAN